MYNKIIINVNGRLYGVNYIEKYDDITYVYTTKNSVIEFKNSVLKNNDIMKLDAEKARSLSENTDNKELSFILNKIKKIATDIVCLDNRTLNIYEKLKESTLNELKNRGFKIIYKCDNPEYMINFVNLKYIIKW